MWNEGDAKKAMINLHGKQFHGRALKVKYSERNASKKDDDIGASEKDGKNSVHVRFSSTNVRAVSFIIPLFRSWKFFQNSFYFIWF
jgi:RNA recognition motif-containing protein